MSRSSALAYHRLLRRRRAMVAALAVILAAAFLLDLHSGASQLGLPAILRNFAGSGQLSEGETAILWQVRLPQACLAVLVGIALATAGAEMQTILANPLASPFTLGVSSAAAFGAALAIVLEASLPFVPADWALSANAFGMALAAVLMLQMLARNCGNGTDALVLCGIALFFTFNALVALSQFIASQQALQQLVFWTMGSLTRANWDKVRVLACVVALTLPFAVAASSRMMALRLGEDRARSAGVDVGRLRFAALLRISLLTAAAIAFVGTIGFVGLAAPHIARLAVGEDHRFFLPASALTGATIMSLASVASRTILPGAVIPIGIVTALIGLPVFFALILSRRSAP